MDHCRHILPSNYQHLSLEDSSELLLQPRQPLSNAAGNAQLRTLASVHLYRDGKGHRLQTDRPMYSIPTVPSQPPRQLLQGTLEQRRQNTRRRRHHRYTRNPIVDSPQYQAYRARQGRDGNQEDAKWPEILEIAFLDALIEIPAMGRRKFTYKGKPHGRNELIKEYLWIAYLQSLAPGQRPDPSMARDRKQVSSHIQVLKGFLKDHPAYDRLFPCNKGPKNGFEDSFKNDPCLKALSEGRLPSIRYEQFENLNQALINPQQASMKPAVFWLLIASTRTQEEYGDLCEKEVVAHRYSRLTSQLHRGDLDGISNWRQRFPYLEPLYSTGELNCDLIHMDVSLDLMGTHAPEGADLVTRSEVSIPGRNYERCEWQTLTCLVKPSELHRDPNMDSSLKARLTAADIMSVSDVETRLKVRFPAEDWANIFTRLTDLQLKYEERQRSQSFGGDNLVGSTRPARDFVDQISMYQEVQSRSGPDMPFTRRAIILWTFCVARPGEGGQTTWRYLNPTPSRRSCMSPSPHPSQILSAVMHENFNAWVDNPLHLQHQNVVDPFLQGPATPANTAGLQPSFAGHDYGYHHQQFDMPAENLSFESTTIDSESTLVDSNAAANIDSFISGATVSIGDYDHNSPHWDVPHTESFDHDPGWANYAISSNTPHLEWTPEMRDHAWPDTSDPKHDNWVEDIDINHDWTDDSTVKQGRNYVEQSANKLSPWIDHSDSGIKDTYSVANDVHPPQLTAGAIDAKEQSWVSGDTGFDFNHLAESLKS